MALLELPSLVVDNVAAVIAAARLLLVNRDPGRAEDGVPIDSAVALELVDTGTDGVARGATRVSRRWPACCTNGAATRVSTKPRQWRWPPNR